MATALTSLLTDRVIRDDVAMTGEVTLRGRVLPVGGIKSKVLAAHRMGLRRIILPKRNEVDIDDIPEEVRDELEFFAVEHMDEVIEAALNGAPTTSYITSEADNLNLGGPSLGPAVAAPRRDG